VCVCVCVCVCVRAGGGGGVKASVCSEIRKTSESDKCSEFQFQAPPPLPSYPTGLPYRWGGGGGRGLGAGLFGYTGFGEWLFRTFPNFFSFARHSTRTKRTQRKRRKPVSEKKHTERRLARRQHTATCYMLHATYCLDVMPLRVEPV